MCDAKCVTVILDKIGKHYIPTDKKNQQSHLSEKIITTVCSHGALCSHNSIFGQKWWASVVAGEKYQCNSTEILSFGLCRTLWMQNRWKICRVCCKTLTVTTTSIISEMQRKVWTKLEYYLNVCEFMKSANFELHWPITNIWSG